MRYKEIKPEGLLSHFIQCFWEYEVIDDERDHTIVPDGYFDLIAIFEDNVLSSVMLTGVWTKPINIFIPKSTKYYAIRFKLLAAEYLFSHEIKSILDKRKQLPLDFWDINEYKTDEFERFVVDISCKLENSIVQLSAIDERKLKLFDAIYKKDSQSVAVLSSKVCWSSRQINRYFNSQFGFSLKEFLKIIRCQSSYKDIARGESFPQIDYYDQAHFIKEVKKYTGSTPTELFKNKNDRFLQLSTIKQG